MPRRVGKRPARVWAAISRLEAEGLLHVVLRQGVFVIAFDEKNIVAIFEAREALEGMAARLATMTAEDREVMTEALSRQARSIETGDLAAYRAANLDFHHRLLVAAQNTTIETTLRRVGARPPCSHNRPSTVSSGPLTKDRPEGRAGLGYVFSERPV